VLLRLGISTHPVLAVRYIIYDIEDRADQSRLSNAGLDRSEHITEGLNVITDISDEDDAESICKISLFTVMKQLFMDCSPRAYSESFFNP
jgi:hypothetical protein